MGERWGRFRDGSLVPLLSRPYVLPAGFFVLTFLVYWFVGPQNTIFDNHINQANSLLHGHLDLVPEHSGFITEPALKDGKMYLQHGLGPALLLLPAVAIWGLSVNQTLVSVLMGALMAPVVLAIVKKMVPGLSAQIWLTVLFMFGTIFWFTASNGGVWFLSHTMAVFFLFIAIYFTIVRRNPLVAGLCLGAAYLSRQTTIMALPFFLIMFAGVWIEDALDRPFARRVRPAPLIQSGAGLAVILLRRVATAPLVQLGLGLLVGFVLIFLRFEDAPEKPLWRRVQITPWGQLGLGLGVFLMVSFVLNFLRFSNPLEGGYSYSEQVHQEELAHVFSHGLLDISYIPRHIPVFIEGLPIFSRDAPYVLPSRDGQAIWATTPAFFLALFAGIKDRRIIVVGAVALALMVAVIVSGELGRALDLGWGRWDFPLGIHLLPLWAMIAVAILVAWRSKDKLILACWAAIIATMIPIFIFAATGWSQFGYRYALDIHPFLFLLVLKAVAGGVRWQHKSLIAASVLINFWGVVWIYQFDEGGLFSPEGFLDLEWFRF